MSETPILFSCDGEQLVGVLHAPATPATLAVLIVVGGPQYRVGSHRQFVLLGRALARSGFACLRFDYCGMGDSAAPARDFQAVDKDIRAAVDALLAQCTGIDEVVLWGLCDGASAALMYVPSDPRIQGVIAVNPWVRSDTSLAQARVSHYYRRRLFDRALWSKLISGRFAWRQSAFEAAATIWRVLHQRSSPQRRERGRNGDSYQQRMALGWQHLRGRVLFVLSGNDFTAAEFLQHARNAPEWQPFPGEEGDALCCVAAADHTFSRTEWNVRLIEHTVQWLRNLVGRRNPSFPDAHRREARKCRGH